MHDLLVISGQGFENLATGIMAKIIIGIILKYWLLNMIMNWFQNICVYSVAKSQ